MSLVDTSTGEVVSDAEVIEELDAEQARALTDRIVHSTTLAAQLVAEAWQGRAWKALGYRSWEDYADGELPVLGATAANRQVLLVGLRNVGMSTRAISAVTGLGQSTVQRRLAGDPNGSPGGVTGTDGKQYPSKIRRTETVEFDSGEAANGDGAGLDAGVVNPSVETGSYPESPTDVEPPPAPSAPAERPTAQSPQLDAPPPSQAPEIARRLKQATQFFTIFKPEQIHALNDPAIATGVDLLIPIVADWVEAYVDTQPTGLSVIEGGRQ